MATMDFLSYNGKVLFIHHAIELLKTALTSEAHKLKKGFKQPVNQAEVDVQSNSLLTAMVRANQF